MSSSRPQAQRTPSDGAGFSITLRIGSRLDQIRMVRAAFSGVLHHLEVQEFDVHLLDIAVAEILNNRLEHAYKGNEHEQIEVRIQVHGSDVQVDILDHAPPFPEEEQYRLDSAADNLEDPSEEWPMRGHGLQIVRRIVDSIAFSTQDNCNCITLKKTVTLQRN